MSTETDLRTLRDFLLQYNAVTEECFNACVVNFTSRDVSEKEESCTKNCMNKVLKVNQRISLRFGEHQLLNMEAQGAPVEAAQNSSGSGNA